MTAPEPTPTEHIDAVARAISTRERGEWNDSHHPDDNRWTWDGDGRTDMERAEFRVHAKTILTSTDPAVHEALAANLPADVMLAALVRAGVLTAETAGPYACPAEERSPWGGWVRCGKFDNHEDDHEDSTSGWHWPRDPDDLEDVPATPPHRLVTPWEVAP